MVFTGPVHCITLEEVGNYSPSEELPLLNDPPKRTDSPLLRFIRGEDEPLPCAVSLVGLISSELREIAEAMRNGTGPSSALHALLLDSGLTIGAICSVTELSPDAVSSTLGLLTAAGVVVQTSMADTLPKFSISGDPQE